MIIPRKLSRGEKVGIVSLSSGVLGEEFIRHEVELLEKRLTEDLGLKYEYMKNARRGIEYLKEHPEARAEDLKQAFLDGEVKIIWCAIGGDDAFRVLPYLLNEEFRKIVAEHPKIFIGYSDSTTDHLMLYKLGLSTYYGPALLSDVAELGPKMLPYTEKSLAELFEVRSDVELQSSPVWYKSRESFGPEQVGVPAVEMKEERGIEFLGEKKVVSGKLLGGCIEILYDLIEHARYPEDQERIFAEYPIFPEKSEWKEKILFIETSEEQPEPEKYRRMIESLERAGVFEAVRGVLVGKPMDEKYIEEYREIIEEKADKYNLVVAFNMNFGHGAPRMVLPIAQDVVLDAEKGKVRLPYPLVAMPDCEIKKVLREKVDEKRYEHSLMVAEMAKRLAGHYGLNEGEAYTAGLVHDAAKRLTDEENRYYVEKYGLAAELVEESARNYVHADVGAVVAKEWFGLSDEIAEAVQYHTIPNVLMTDFDKVVFLADKVGRKDLSESMMEIKELTFKDLDVAMLTFLERQEVELRERGIAQHPQTIKMMDALRKVAK